MRFSWEIGCLALLEADADFAGLELGSQKAVVVAAAVADTLHGLGVKAQHRDDYYVELAGRGMAADRDELPFFAD